ncbi:hypothetical protein HJFPF1_10457 [Paramyrothecium foliicola]|nr:hypothetical protein HJFPF1_10457 [Paramyrothecium foliicola]
MTEKVLDSSLLDALTDATKAALIDNLLRPNSQGSILGHALGDASLELDAYWTFYARECSRALHNGGRHVALRNHSDVVECAQKLRAGLSREDLKDLLRPRLSSFHANEDEMLDNSIDLAATLLLMTSFCSYAYGFSGRSQLNWDGNLPLKDFMAASFEPGHAFSDTGVKLEKIFTATNLQRIAGLDIVWTDNLVDHLRLTDDDSRVHVFHHASFLETQKQSNDSLLPTGLAEETLRTLALLFPSGDGDTRRWTSRVATDGEENSLDRRLIQCGRLKTDNRQIDCFHFWRDRLVTLKQVFDEAQPKSLSHWWHDRRNRVQWYTFWVAVLVLALTIFFGLVQSVEGALQVYASFKAMHESEGGGGKHGNK